MSTKKVYMSISLIKILFEYESKKKEYLSMSLIKNNF